MMPGSDLEIPIRPVTQEEYDHFMTLYNAVDQVYDPDEALTAIIREEALAFLYPVPQAEKAARAAVFPGIAYIAARPAEGGGVHLDLRAGVQSGRPAGTGSCTRRSPPSPSSPPPGGPARWGTG
mgnify:CR=1 FL=1